MEQILSFHAVQLFSGIVITPVEFAGSHSRKLCNRIGDEFEANTLGNQLVCIIVVGIRYHNDFFVHGVALQNIGAVADQRVRAGSPCIAIGFDDILTDRIIGRESHDLQEPCARLNQSEFDRFGIESLYAQFIHALGTGGDIQTVEQVLAHVTGIRSSSSRVYQTLHGVYKVISSQIFAVRPFSIFTDVEGVNQTIITNLILVSSTENDAFAVPAILHQAFKKMLDVVGTIGSRVQLRIKCFRL